MADKTDDPGHLPERQTTPDNYRNVTGEPGETIGVGRRWHDTRPRWQDWRARSGEGCALAWPPWWWGW